MKTVYFIVKKNWAVRENFGDIVEHLQDLGDTDIVHHMQNCSSRSTYTSVASVDEFIKCISDRLEGEMLTKVLMAHGYSLLADETTDMADRAVLSIFLRYLNSDTRLVTEEYLGLVEVVGSKGAEALCELICEVLQKKGVEINELRFHDLDGTNAMSGEISGLQRRLRHKAPHSKYMNCRNHRLALVFVHLMPRFQCLSEVDASILAVWKAMKYSSVKSAVFNERQAAEGLQKMKLLKCATTRWLSHGEASARIISRFVPLINSLDAIIDRKYDADLRGVRDQLLEPDNVLFLLLLADVLAEVNRFSKFLQQRGLIFANIKFKLGQLISSLRSIQLNDGSLFNEHAHEFLGVSQERMQLARRVRGNALLGELDNLDDKIAQFKERVKVPFMNNLFDEINNAMLITDEELLAFDVFNPRCDENNEEKVRLITTLLNFYGEEKTSTFKGDLHSADRLFDIPTDINQSATYFLEDFNLSMTKLEKKRNEEIMRMIKDGKLANSSVDRYKSDHPIPPDLIYKDMFSSHDQYPQIMQVFKLSLLVPPSTANVERGFSVLNLVHTKQRNRLAVKSLDRLLRIVLIGPEKLDDDTYEMLINEYRDMIPRRIEL